MGKGGSRRNRRRGGLRKSNLKVLKKAKSKTAKDADGKKVRRKYLTAEQKLAVNLMQAREVIQTKNAAIANQKTAYAQELKGLHERITGLETELAAAMAQVLQAGNNTEATANEALRKEHSLPDGRIDYKIDPKSGEMYFEEPFDEEKTKAVESEPEPESEPESVAAEEEEDGDEDGDEEEEPDAPHERKGVVGTEQSEAVAP